MNIKQTNNTQPNIYALIVGLSGVGKTTLAGTLKEKTFIVSAEAGLLSLANKSIDYIELEGSDSEKFLQLKEVMKFIKESNYRNIFFDSITEISEIVQAHSEKEFPDARNSLQRWGLYTSILKSMIKYTRDLNKNVFITALQKTSTDELNRRYYTPDVAGSMSLKMPAFFDLVFAMRIIKKDDADLRILQTQSDSGYICKDRSNKLNKYEQPDLQKILDKITNKGDINEKKKGEIFDRGTRIKKNENNNGIKMSTIRNKPK